MFVKPARIWALLCFFLVLQLATAQSFRIVRRQDGSPATTTNSDPEPTTDDGADQTSSTTTSVETDAADSETGSDSKASATDEASDSTRTAPVPTSTIIETDGPLDNSTLRNVTIPEGQLPLTPEITPGWGVAGVIMLGTGVVYTLIGIKNRWIHTFFSTAYLVSLAITVLIVYVMSAPVRDAVQGAYVAAAVLSGCAIGAGSMFFKELTEGLGCALGGFCVSMWLLCLVPGGLLHTVASKAIFIACFSLVGFAFYFSRWTRDWALITMISFAGGTVTVLGIDCFSRAGLKEFWAYIWDLNDDLFPFGTQTYPVTKGIRVETAAIVIIFLFGIISQIKLWRIVRDKKKKRAEERAAAQRDLEKEEANLGRQLEETNARERRQWERTYGDGEVGSSTASGGSLGDAASEKRLTATHQKTSVEVIEMADMSESGPEPDHLMATGQGDEGKVMVRVAADDFPEGPPPDDQQADEVAESRTGSIREGQTDIAEGKHVSRIVSQAPEVVPLPFRVPAADDVKSQGDRSSVATFADEEGQDATAPGQRRSFAKRLSHNSADLLRSMSPRSPRSGVSPSEFHGEGGESSEELVVPDSPRLGGDNGSIAATLDDASLSGEDFESVKSPTQSKSFEINAELSGREDEQILEPGPPVAAPPADDDPKKPRPFSTATVSTTILPESEGATNPATHAPKTIQAPESATQGGPEPEEAPVPEASGKLKSATSTASNPVSLTKDRLPRSLSRVAMSYRTNEWAKHLSLADAPEPDELEIAESARATKVAEKPAPVMLEDLQQTGDNGEPPMQVPTPAPATVRRSDSQLSHLSTTRRLSRSASQPGMTINTTMSGAIQQEPSPPGRSPQGAPGAIIRTSSSNMALRRSSSNFQPIVEEADANILQPTIAEDEKEDGIVSDNPPFNPTEAQRVPVPGVVSYASPQTLLGQREMYLRSKSYGNLISPTPEPVLSPASSDAGSLLNYPMYAAALPVDPDDMPLSQRKQLMRHSSAMSLQAAGVPQPTMQRSSTIDLNTNFDSHQPNRHATIPTHAARESQLASFRQSVAADLRSGSPMMTVSGRETPFASTTNLLTSGREADVARNIDLQRNALMNQKEAEVQRREMQRREKEWASRAFDERMRSGDLLEAHREAMRKMQKGVKE